MKQIDKTAIETYGIPAVVLMENAGREVAMVAKKILNKIKGKCIVLVCGTGNNAGDGFVAARYLHNYGFKVKVVLLSREKKFKNAAFTNFNIIKKMKLPITTNLTNITTADLVIDAIFGTGLRNNVEGIYRNAIEYINNANKPVVAIDIPSGIHGDTGEVLGIAVKAKVTVTMGLVKKGLLKAKRYTGKIITADIGLPRL